MMHFRTTIVLAIGAIAVAAFAAMSPATQRAEANEQLRQPGIRASAPLEPLSTTSPVPRAARVLALEDLTALAMANHPALRIAVAKVEAACGNWEQSGLYPNPTAGYVANDIGDNGSAGKQGGFVSQEVVTADKLRLNRGAAAQLVRRMRQDLAAQRLRVTTDVRTRYYEVLAAERQVQLSTRLAEIGGETLRLTESLLKPGLEATEVSRIDLLRARVDRETASIGLETARQNRAAAWRRLTASLGLPHMEPVELRDELEAMTPPIAWDDAVERLMRASPELSSARTEVDRLRWSLDRSWAERVPNATAMVMLQRDTNTNENLVGVQVGMPVPVYNRNQGAIRKAEAELAAGRAETARVELFLYRNLADVYQQYASARRQVDVYRTKILPDTSESLALLENSFRHGQIDRRELLAAERPAIEVRLRYLAALVELKRNEAAIDGFLLLGGDTAVLERGTMRFDSPIR